MASKTSTFFDLKTCLGKSYRHSTPEPEVRKVSSMEENKGLNKKLYKSGGHWFWEFRLKLSLITWKNMSSEFATFHSVLGDRRATARMATR